MLLEVGYKYIKNKIFKTVLSVPLFKSARSFIIKPKEFLNLHAVILLYHLFIIRENLFKICKKSVKNTQTSNENSTPTKRRVLYFSPYPSHPDGHGNQSTIKNFGKFLRSQEMQVDFVLLESNMFNESDLKVMKKSWDSVTIIKNSNIVMDDKKKSDFDGWYGYGLGEQLGVIARQKHSDIMLCSYVFQSRILEYMPVGIKKIIDTHDKMGNRHELLRSWGLPVSFFSCDIADEAAYLKRAHIVIARNVPEANYFNKITNRECSVVVPHFEPPKFKSHQRSIGTNIGLVASNNIINKNIVLELIQKCRNRFGDAGWPFQLFIAGNIENVIKNEKILEGWNGNKWIRIIGFVENIAQFYDNMDIIISPVTVGTGINVKTVEALAFGMPLLSTKPGSKGIETEEEQHLHESTDDLIKSLQKVCGDEQEVRRLAEVSRSIYTRFYTAACRQLLDCVQ